VHLLFKVGCGLAVDSRERTSGVGCAIESVARRASWGTASAMCHDHGTTVGIGPPFVILRQDWNSDTNDCKGYPVIQGQAATVLQRFVLSVAVQLRIPH